MAYTLDEFKNSVLEGQYTPFGGVIRSLSREAYATVFEKNFEMATKLLEEGKIQSLDTNLINSTCWVGPGQTLIDNPAATINPLLKGTKVAVDSAESDYADKLSAVLAKSKVSSVEMPTEYATNGVTIWKTSQEERDKIMASLPSTVKKFSNGYGWSGFTNKDLQNLTDLMNRNPGIEIHLCFSTYGNPKVGPFDDKTYAAFLKAAKKSNGIYLDHPGHTHNPLFMSGGSGGGHYLAERETMLEHSVGAKGVETTFGRAYDSNYTAKQKQKTNRYEKKL